MDTRSHAESDTSEESELESSSSECVGTPASTVSLQGAENKEGVGSWGLRMRLFNSARIGHELSALPRQSLRQQGFRFEKQSYGCVQEKLHKNMTRGTFGCKTTAALLWSQPRHVPQ